jgi:hypothetical protein
LQAEDPCEEQEEDPPKVTGSSSYSASKSSGFSFLIISRVIALSGCLADNEIIALKIEL